MDIGLGLPISNPRHLIGWARRAEASGLDSLAVLDRLVFDNPEPLITLAALAGATERIRLQTEVLLGPAALDSVARQAGVDDRSHVRRPVRAGYRRRRPCR